MTEWTSRHTHWIIGGDLNETRAPVDSARVSEFKDVPKFVNGFLDDSQGVDLWRVLHPQKPGFSYRSDNGLSHSRLDYFLVSPILLETAHPRMRIAEWLPKQDHARISFNFSLAGQLGKRKIPGDPWSIPQPRMFNLNNSNRASCKSVVREPLEDLLRLQPQNGKMDPDKLSKATARIIVEKVSEILGSKANTHKKASYLSTDVCRNKGLITTICKARDGIRILLKREYESAGGSRGETAPSGAV